MGQQLVPLKVPDGLPGAGGSILSGICGVAVRLLNPTQDDSAANNVGGLVFSLIGKLSGPLGQTNVAQLIRSVVIRLFSAHFPPLIESLLLLLARILHQQGGQLLKFLEGLGNVPVLQRHASQAQPTPETPYPRIEYILKQ